MSESKRRRDWSGAGVGLGIFLALAFLYGTALWRLAHQTSEMDNKFSQLARKDHLAFLIGENVRVLKGYVMVGLAAWCLIRPWAGVGFREWRNRFPWVWAIATGSAGLFLIHGYFLARLVDARPYFLPEGALGAWYYQLLSSSSWWGDGVRYGLFQIFPWVFLAVTLWLWWRSLGRVGRGALAVLLIGGLAAGVAAPGGEGVVRRDGGAEDPRPNILIIGSDSLRGDRVGYAGYRPRRTDGAAVGGVSPEIDRWAEGAAKFLRCYTPIASTLESSTSMMSSTYPHTHGIRQMYPDRKQVEETEGRIRTLAQILGEAGYETAAIGDWCASFYGMMPLGFQEISVSSYDNFQIYMSQAVLMAHFVVPLYFDNPVGYRIFPEIGSFAQFVTPKVVTERVKKKLRERQPGDRPFFWHVFYSCNHLPYRSAKPYYNMFTDPAYRGPHQTGVDFDINSFISATDLEDKLKVLSPDQIEQIRGLYDGCTRSFDDCFAEVMRELEASGQADRTIVVVMADHGDDLYEPGVTLTHGLGFNGADHCSHLPLAIRAPGMPGMATDRIVRTIDLAPTLLDLAGMEVPADWEGRTLAEAWRKGEEPVSRPFFGETSFPFIQFRVAGIERPELPPMDELTWIDPEYHYHFVLRPEWKEAVNRAKQRVLRTERWKVVCTPTREGGRHFGLFQVADDPDCRVDLAGERPEVLEPMRRALETWIDERRELSIAEIFPGGEP